MILQPTLQHDCTGEADSSVPQKVGDFTSSFANSTTAVVSAVLNKIGLSIPDTPSPAASVVASPVPFSGVENSPPSAGSSKSKTRSPLAQINSNRKSSNDSSSKGHLQRTPMAASPHTSRTNAVDNEGGLSPHWLKANMFKTLITEMTQLQQQIDWQRSELAATRSAHSTERA